MNLSYTSQEQVEVYRFAWPIALGAPIVALLLQAALPANVFYLRVFDLPLLVTIFFAISRRSPISGLLTGAVIGLAQDCLTMPMIGVLSMAKTLVGYIASSLGVRIDVENKGTRFLMTVCFYVLHQAIFYGVSRSMAGMAFDIPWISEAGFALANALLGVAIYAMLDRFKIKI